MDDFFNAREYGWTESSNFDISIDPLADDLESDSGSNGDNEVPFAWHGPLIEVDPSDLSNQREFWGNCAIGFILDYRKFSMGYLQHIINFAWLIKGSVTIVGRDSYFYILHFEHMDDLYHVCTEGPWSVDEALFILEQWRPNLVLGRLQLNFVSLWVRTTSWSSP